MEHDRLSALPIQSVCLDTLFSLVDLGANPWGIGEIRAQDVQAYKKRKGHLPESFDWHPNVWDHQWTRSDHIQRIGELMDADPAQIKPVLLDVGEPGKEDPWPVIDGHHRILAAWFAGHTHIQARVAGDPIRAQRMLGLGASGSEQAPRSRKRMPP